MNIKSNLYRDLLTISWNNVVNYKFIKKIINSSNFNFQKQNCKKLLRKSDIY